MKYPRHSSFSGHGQKLMKLLLTESFLSEQNNSKLIMKGAFPRPGYCKNIMVEY
jgi:hypothetical protein